MKTQQLYFLNYNRAMRFVNLTFKKKFLNKIRFFKYSTLKKKTKAINRVKSIYNKTVNKMKRSHIVSKFAHLTAK